MTLASLGADVIRIDPIGGASDTTRAPVDAEGTSIYWASMNKSKRSVMLDLRRQEGQELAIAIATAAGSGTGYFVTNAVGDGWFSERSLRAHRSDLIWVRLLGNADGRPALDYTVNWEVGFAAATGPGDSDAPTMHVLPAWDLLAGMHVALSLLAADRRRNRTGTGETISLSLADVALWSTDALGILAEVQIMGHARERTGDFVYGTFGTSFTTSDGPPVIIVALTRRQWLDLVDVTEADAVIAELEAEVGALMEDENVRWLNRERIRELMAPWFASRTTAEVLRALHGTRLVSSALSSFEDTANGPMVRENPLFTPVIHPLLGAVRAMGNPSVFSGWSDRPEPVAPVLGQHTEEVLSETLGLTHSEIGMLIDRKVAAGSEQ
jgi:2-methylfumaryl-CoA isomerase